MKDLILFEENFITTYTEKGAKALEYAKNIIVNQETAVQVQESLQKIKNVRLEIDKERKSKKDPHIKAGRSIDDLAKNLSSPIGEAENIIQDKLYKYQKDQDRIRQEEEQRLAKELEEKEEKLKNELEENKMFGDTEKEIAEEFEAKKEELLQQKAEETLEISSKIVTLSNREMIDFEILDEVKIPKDLCSPDDKKIRAYRQANLEFIEEQITKSSNNSISLMGIKFYKKLKF